MSSSRNSTISPVIPVKAGIHQLGKMDPGFRRDDVSFRRYDSFKGFTLIELIIVIVIGGILATMISTMIVGPIEGFVAAGRRAELVDMGENTVRKIQRDIRSALPNSVRVDGTAQVFELIHVRDAGRYRVGVGPGNSDPACLFTNLAADGSFGIFSNLSTGTTTAADRIVISNWNNSGTIANAYMGNSGDNISPSTSTVGLHAADATCNEPYLTLSTPFFFQHQSPRQRFYLVDTPISYVCDTGTGTLTRYRNYALAQTQPNSATLAALAAAGSAQAAVVAVHLSTCNFSYTSGTNTGQRSGVATLSIQISQDGESIQLLHQVHVDNMP